MIPRLDKSFCGCSLYTGSLILAWLYTIVSLVGGLLLAVLGPLIFSFIEKDAKKHGEELEEKTLLLLRTLYGVALVIFLIGIFINGSLLYGVYKRNHCLMMPHLIYAGIGLCFSALINLFFLFVAFVSVVNFTQFLVYVLHTVVAGYLWLIIYSHFKHLKEEAMSNVNTFNKL